MANYFNVLLLAVAWLTVVNADLGPGLNGMNYQISNTDITEFCFIPPLCNPVAPYRTIDGTCNNLVRTLWGAFGQPLVHFADPVYSNDKSAPRKSSDGSDLPNARDLHLNLFPDVNNPSQNLTELFMSFAQITAHDTSLSNPMALPPDVDCCEGGVAQVNSQCISVALSPDDPVYGKYGQTCMNITRTSNTAGLACQQEPVQQLESITHYLDLSQTYGSTDDLAKSLRTLKDGLLQTRPVNDHDYLPALDVDICDPRATVCYKCGDRRGNQNLGLSMLQTIFVREHNRIATFLAKINPLWSDEVLYQEARRIAIAEYQHIVYHEFLPILLPGTTWNQPYDIRVNVATINEFATGCFRLLHSLIQGHEDFTTQTGEVKMSLQMRDWFERSDIIEQENNFDLLIGGRTHQASQAQDIWVSDEIGSYFDKLLKPYGQDLIATDIQRGRDHGLPSYNKLRAILGSPLATEFSDFNDTISDEYIQKLSQFYTSADDVDLYVGALLESKSSEDILGPTCSKVVFEQFRRWKVADLYYYTNPLQPKPFTLLQLGQLSNSNMARILCDNGNNITEIQASPFLQINDQNPVVSCDSLPQVSLLPWNALG